MYGVYAIIDSAVHGSAGSVEAACAAESSGATWIQLRLKGSSDREAHEVARLCCERMAAPAQRLWVNDRVQLAAVLPVCGVHLGQDDLPTELARRLLRSEQLIGRSTHDDEQVASADADADVDVVAIGPILATTSKADADPVVGWQGLERARALTDKPLVAIGGLGTDESYQEARRRGADLVAMISALGRGASVGRRCAELSRLEV